MTNTNKETLRTQTPFNLYKLLLNCIDVLIEKKSEEKAKMESEGIHDINYAALVNEISTLRKAHTELMLFFG